MHIERPSETHARVPLAPWADRSTMRTNRTWNGVVFNLGEVCLDSLPAPQPMILAKEEPHDDHHHYRL